MACFQGLSARAGLHDMLDSFQGLSARAQLHDTFLLNHNLLLFLFFLYMRTLLGWLHLLVSVESNLVDVL